MKDQPIRIAIADDHILLRKGLVQLLEDGGFSIVADADNGEELIEAIRTKTPDVVLMDISMPRMNGLETTQWLKRHMPDVRVIALSMFDDEMYIIRMIRAGARGYVLKDAEPIELRRAIREVYEKGFHFSELVTGKLVHHVTDPSHEMPEIPKLSEREEEFLKLACTEMTYKEIAGAMNVSPRTVDNYRDALFEKLEVSSRVGLVMYAVRMKFVLV